MTVFLSLAPDLMEPNNALRSGAELDCLMAVDCVGGGGGGGGTGGPKN